jgi:hypothetical protein
MNARVEEGLRSVQCDLRHRVLGTQYSVLSTRLWLSAVFFTLLAAAIASAASPRDELLRLVPDNVGFCVLIEDLRGHGAALVDSPFVRQFASTPFGSKVVHSPETEKLDAVDKFLQLYLNVTATQLRDEILGDALVVAYRPAPSRQPGQDQGLFLVRARNAELLAGLVGRLNELQEKSGDLESVEAKEHAGRKYIHRTERNGENYYYLRGPVLAFAPHEEILHEVIDLDRKAPLEGEPPVARQFRLLGVGQPLAALWINPRAFVPALEQKASSAEGAPAVPLRALLGYWKALEGIAVSLVLEKDVAVSLAVRGRTTQLPPSAVRFLNTAAEPSSVAESFPVNAVLTATGRLDLSALAETISGFLPDEARTKLQEGMDHTIGAVLGKDVLKDLLPQLGPDWGFYAVAPPAKDPRWFPYAVLALRVRGNEPLLQDALDSLAVLALYNLNGGHAGAFRLRSATQEQTPIKCVVNDQKFPPGFQPAYGIKEGYLVVASSPKALHGFHAPSARSATTNVPLFRLSLPALRDYLKERREALVQHAAATKPISAEEAGRQLDGLLCFLQLFERVEVTQHTNPGRVIWTLRLQTTLPLK